MIWTYSYHIVPRQGRGVRAASIQRVASLQGDSWSPWSSPALYTASGAMYVHSRLGRFSTGGIMKWWTPHRGVYLDACCLSLKLRSSINVIEGSRALPIHGTVMSKDEDRTIEGTGCLMILPAACWLCDGSLQMWDSTYLQMLRHLALWKRNSSAIRGCVFHMY